jgi:AcrR family transcriptional regulator
VKEARHVPRPRFDKLDPLRRRQILELAAGEFASHGYQHASLNHIIEALGLNKGVFYYYFDSKADLFASVMGMVWQTALPEAMDVERLERETFWPGMQCLLRDNHRRMREQPWLAGFLKVLVDAPGASGIDAVVAEQMSAARLWITRLLRRGQEVGAVRTDLPEDLLLDVLTRADQAADRWLLANWDRLTSEERDRAGLLTLDLWRRIANPPAASGSLDRNLV